MKNAWKYVKIAALLALPTALMATDGFDVEKSELTSRPFVEADREWASEVGVKAYMEMYKGQAYYWGADYEFLAPTDDAGKEKRLWDDAKTLVDTYLKHNGVMFHSFVLNYKEQDIGGVFYRVASDGLLILDEFVLVDSVSSDLKKYILDEYLRKLEPDCQIFTFSLRPINNNYMTLFNDLGYRPQFPDVVKETGYDPVLYMGLVKTFA